jgi:formiminotetrahydrofolate cyclodeaminase
LEVARQAAALFEKLGQLEGMSSPSMLSDIRVGRLMAVAAAQGALANVAINLESITDAGFSGRLNSEAQSLKARIMEQPVGAGKS